MTVFPLPEKGSLAAPSDALLESYARPGNSIQHLNSYELPSMTVLETVIEQSRALLFPGFVGEPVNVATAAELSELVRGRVLKLYSILCPEVYRGIHHRDPHAEGRGLFLCERCKAKASSITHKYIASFAALRPLLAKDVAACFEGDPAATGRDEVTLCYPGVYAVTVYRLAHVLLGLGAKLLPRMMSEIAHAKVGIEIHPAARIGESFFIDHGCGVVIGETADIGSRVKIYQSVTLGALSINEREEVGVKRHPTIEDECVIYSGATILGGETVVGKGSVIGGNTWVVRSVPPQSKVFLSQNAAQGAS